MRRYWTVAVATAAVFTVVFGVVQALDIEVLTEPGSAMTQGLPAAAVGVALLVTDALLPVPSSVIMTLHGAMFGVGIGAFLSIVGRVGAAAAGFAAGRSGSSLLERAVGDEEHARSIALLTRWGWGAIVLSRPVPLVAETVIMLAGASRMSWRTAMAAAVLRSLPEALTYALAGAALATFDASVAVFLSLLLVVAVAWVLAGRRGRSGPGLPPDPHPDPASPKPGKASAPSMVDCWPARWPCFKHHQKVFGHMARRGLDAFQCSCQIK